MMKYEIDTMMTTITEENIDDIDEILFGEPLEVIGYSEGSELMDEEEARAEFDKLVATARKNADGTIDIRIPQLIRGEQELDKDVLEEEGEEVYYIREYEVVEQKEFDEESLILFRELGFKI